MSSHGETAEILQYFPDLTTKSQLRESATVVLHEVGEYLDR